MVATQKELQCDLIESEFTKGLRFQKDICQIESVVSGGSDACAAAQEGFNHDGDSNCHNLSTWQRSVHKKRLRGELSRARGRALM